ncbi:hypothetical protein [Paraburkholderia heleia]|uniref:hypothetical protein n=1 Tax=Paraburkholderia heleia TaxID=634127 RepID=UPI002AB74373|nr:hypothetical protein [Paraburkholderia heleia]
MRYRKVCPTLVLSIGLALFDASQAHAFTSDYVDDDVLIHSTFRLEPTAADLSIRQAEPETTQSRDLGETSETLGGEINAASGLSDARIAAKEDVPLPPTPIDTLSGTGSITGSSTLEPDTVANDLQRADTDTLLPVNTAPPQDTLAAPTVNRALQENQNDAMLIEGQTRDDLAASHLAKAQTQSEQAAAHVDSADSVLRAAADASPAAETETHATNSERISRPNPSGSGKEKEVLPPLTPLIEREDNIIRSSVTQSRLSDVSTKNGEPAESTDVAGHISLPSQEDFPPGATEIRFGSEFRDKFEELWRNSFSPETKSVRENGALIVQNIDNGVPGSLKLLTEGVLKDQRTDRLSFNREAVPAGSVVVGTFHTHPYDYNSDVHYYPFSKEDIHNYILDGDRYSVIRTSTGLEAMIRQVGPQRWPLSFDALSGGIDHARSFYLSQSNDSINTIKRSANEWMGQVYSLSYLRESGNGKLSQWRPTVNYFDILEPKRNPEDHVAGGSNHSSDEEGHKVSGRR